MLVYQRVYESSPAAIHHLFHGRDRCPPKRWTPGNHWESINCPCGNCFHSSIVGGIKPVHHSFSCTCIIINHYSSLFIDLLACFWVTPCTMMYVPCTIVNHVFQHHVSTMYQPFMARASRPWRRHPGPSAPLWSRRWHCWQASVQRPGGQRSMDWWDKWQESLIPSGKHTKNYGKSWKITIFNG